MSQILYGTPTHYTPTQARSLHSAVNLRLAFGLGSLLGTIIFFFGVSWDLQWHSVVGRDRTLIPPHEMMLLGIIVTGLAALALVLIETGGARRNPALAQYSTTFAGGFSGPLGAYIAGFGALDSALAFVLDSYWHALYGIDTPILAPFHVMLLAGVAISGLGSAYLLVGVAQLAEDVGDRVKTRVGYIGASVAFSSIITMLGLLSIETVLGEGDHQQIVNVFPLMAGLGCTWILVAAVNAIPWRWAATLVSGITICLLLLMAAFVPVAMNVLMTLEHIHYRDIVTSKSIIRGFAQLAILWPLTTAFIASFLIDQSMARAKRKDWSQGRLMRSLVLAALPICLPVMPIIPIIFFMLFILSPLGGILSLGLGLLGILSGIWLGQRTGKAMQAGR